MWCNGKKVKYYTQAKAIEALVDMSNRQAHNDTARYMTPYWCGACKCWHLTSQQRKTDTPKGSKALKEP